MTETTEQPQSEPTTTEPLEDDGATLDDDGMGEGEDE